MHRVRSDRDEVLEYTWAIPSGGAWHVVAHRSRSEAKEDLDGVSECGGTLTARLSDDSAELFCQVLAQGRPEFARTAKPEDIETKPDGEAQQR